MIIEDMAKFCQVLALRSSWKVRACSGSDHPHTYAPNTNTCKSSLFVSHSPCLKTTMLVCQLMALGRRAPRGRPTPLSLYIFNSPNGVRIPNGHFIICFCTFCNSQLGNGIPSGHFIMCFYTSKNSKLGIEIPNGHFILFLYILQFQLGIGILSDDLSYAACAARGLKNEFWKNVKL